MAGSVLSTTGGNLVVAVRLCVLAGLSPLRAPTRTQGLLWGLAGCATFVLAPTLGLPPELPGTAAADLTLRQTWWIRYRSLHRRRPGADRVRPRPGC